MTTAALSLQFHQKDRFDSHVLRSMLGGMGALLIAGATGSKAPLLTGTWVAAIACAALAASTLSGARPKSRAVLAATFPFVALAFGSTALWTWAIAGAAAGLTTCVPSWLADPQDSIGTLRPSRAHYGATVLTTGAFALFGAATATTLHSWLLTQSAPWIFAFLLAGATLGLFVGLGALPLYVQLDGDPAEAKLDRIKESLPADFRHQVGRALGTYRAVGAALATLPKEPAREALAKTVTRLLVEMEGLASDWAGVEDQMEATTATSLKRDIADLKTQAHGSRDTVVRAQLLAAASSLEEELSRLAEVRVRRERILAKLTVQATLLERTRVSLLGLRSGHAQIKAAGLNALNRRLETMVNSQQHDADTAADVALDAELEALEVSTSEVPVVANSPAEVSPALRVVRARST